MKGPWHDVDHSHSSVIQQQQSNEYKVHSWSSIERSLSVQHSQQLFFSINDEIGSFRYSSLCPNWLQTDIFFLFFHLNIESYSFSWKPLFLYFRFLRVLLKADFSFPEYICFQLLFSLLIKMYFNLNTSSCFSVLYSVWTLWKFLLFWSKG